MNFQSNTGRKSHLSIPRTYTKGKCVNGIYRNVPQGFQWQTPTWPLLEIKHHFKKKEWFSLVGKLGTNKVTSTAPEGSQLSQTWDRRLRGVTEEHTARATQHPFPQALSEVLEEEPQVSCSPLRSKLDGGDRFESKPTFLMSTQCLF